MNERKLFVSRTPRGSYVPTLPIPGECPHVVHVGYSSADVPTTLKARTARVSTHCHSHTPTCVGRGACVALCFSKHIPTSRTHSSTLTTLTHLNTYQSPIRLFFLFLYSTPLNPFITYFVCCVCVVFFINKNRRFLRTFHIRGDEHNDIE